MARTGGNEIGSKIGLMPSLCLTVAVLYVTREVLIPLSVAILFAFCLTPAVTWFERRRFGRFLSIFLVVGASLAAVGAVTWVVEQQFVEFGVFPITGKTFKASCAEFEALRRRSDRRSEGGGIYAEKRRDDKSQRTSETNRRRCSCSDSGAGCGSGAFGSMGVSSLGWTIQRTGSQPLGDDGLDAGFCDIHPG